MTTLLRVVGVFSFVGGLFAGSIVAHFQEAYLLGAAYALSGGLSGLFLVVVAGAADDLHALRQHFTPEVEEEVRIVSAADLT